MLTLTTARRVIATICLAEGIVLCLGLSSFAQTRSVLDRGAISSGQTTANTRQEVVQAPVPQDEAIAEEDLDVLLRGQLHEAFAEVVQQNPVPNPVVPKQPPEPLQELPPEYKPAGTDVQWIPGYWDWDEEKLDFVWISGIWRDIPPGQRWVPGYWEPADSGFRRVSGFWMTVEVDEITYLPPPPESLDIGPSTPAPSENHFYAPGSWVYQSGQYIWQPGCWMPRVEQWVWIPPTYIWTPAGCVYRPGYWDRLLDCRGMIFAPVCFRRPIYLEPGFYYTPRCVIRTDFGLLPHLFVRVNCRSYYFGDWYDDRYLSHGYCAWSYINRWSYYDRCYDPFFAHYNSPAFRHNHVSLVFWVRDRHDHYHDHADSRPQKHFDEHADHRRRADHDDDDHEHSEPAELADTLQRHVKKASEEGRDGEEFEELDSQERKEIDKLADPIRTLARERQSVERSKRPDSEGDRDDDADEAEESSRTSTAKLSLPKVDRKQREAAERAAIQLQREQEQLERAAKLAERREQRDLERAGELPAPAVELEDDDAEKSRGRRQRVEQPDNARLPVEKTPNEKSNDGEVLPQENPRISEPRSVDREETEQRIAPAQPDLQHRRQSRERDDDDADEIEIPKQRFQQDARPDQFQPRRNESQPRRDERQIEPSKRSEPQSTPSQVIEPQRQQQLPEMQHRELQRQKDQQRQLEAQQQRAAQQAAQQSKQLQRDAESAARKQQEAQERSQRRQQLEMESQLRKAQENQAQQQREMERQRRDAESAARRQQEAQQRIQRQQQVEREHQQRRSQEHQSKQHREPERHRREPDRSKQRSGRDKDDD